MAPEFPYCCTACGTRFASSSESPSNYCHGCHCTGTIERRDDGEPAYLRVMREASERAAAKEMAYAINRKREQDKLAQMVSEYSTAKRSKKTAKKSKPIISRSKEPRIMLHFNRPDYLYVVSLKPKDVSAVDFLSQFLLEWQATNPKPVTGTVSKPIRTACYLRKTVHESLTKKHPGATMNKIFQEAVQWHRGLNERD